MIDTAKVMECFRAIQAEYERARTKHKPMNSPHEAYAVIKEEVDEFWDYVKANWANRGELVQVAAMCVAALCELPLIGDYPGAGKDGAK